MSALKPPSTQTSTVRAELAHLNGVHEDFSLERAAVHRVLNAVVALITSGGIPFDEWQQRCLVSAAAFFDREQYRQCARQLDALFVAQRASLMCLMPELPETAVAAVMRQFATQAPRMEQANVALRGRPNDRAADCAARPDGARRSTSEEAQLAAGARL
jgi:hypothetical protein